MLPRKCLPVLLLAGLLISACQPVAAPALDGSTAAKIDAIVERTMEAYQAPGFALCVVQDGQVVYRKGFGLADVEAGRPYTPQSVSIQASVTKPLVAMAVLRLAEQGVLDLDAPAARYLPAFHMADERYGAITVRMLLAHTGGLPDTPKDWGAPLDPTVDPLAQAVGSLTGQRLIYAPGTGWSYSDYGYALLGAIIGAVSGRPFATYMREEWLQPLGMAHATFRAEEVDPDQRVKAYMGDARGEPVATPIGCDARATQQTAISGRAARTWPGGPRG